MEDRDRSLAHVLGRLGVVEARVGAEVTRRRAGDAAPDDRFRGLYFSDEELDRLLQHPAPPAGEDDGLRARVEAQADADEAAGHDLRLRRLARVTGLSALDEELLLLALAPDVDPRFERLYGYLHDDVSRRRATVGLSLRLAGAPATDAAARARLLPDAPLLQAGLVVVGDPERPFLSRPLTVPDRVTMHLLGDDAPCQELRPLLASPSPSLEGDYESLGAAIEQGAGLIYVRERPGSSGRALAAAAFATLELGTVALDLLRLGQEDDIAALAAMARREGQLRGAGIVAGPIDVLAERGVGAVRAFAELGWPVVLTGSRSWDPSWSRDVPLVVSLKGPKTDERVAVWRSLLNGASPGFDLADVTGTYTLDADQIRRAVTAAELRASYERRDVDAEDLRHAARSQSGGALERLAHRIEPRATWDDIVLPAKELMLLRELTSRVRLRKYVLEDWSMAQTGRRGDGVAALFAGGSGTGKTLAAEVIAHDIGFDLYTVDLATVVDKYIGETEKNLDRIFGEAERVNGVLFFDEADALFGKRSDVRDAHDRYANVEVAYLLQRMEAFDGVVILATNLRSNIDPAFARRLDALVDFPMPKEEQRRELWDRCLGPAVPREPALDLNFCARAFDLSGGSIRNIALAAAYFAAEEERAVATADLIRATEREYRKLGRLCLERDFGPYFSIIAA